MLSMFEDFSKNCYIQFEIAWFLLISEFLHSWNRRPSDNKNIALLYLIKLYPKDNFNIK
jgi:hypothetical protein